MKTNAKTQGCDSALRAADECATLDDRAWNEAVERLLWGHDDVDPLPATDVTHLCSVILPMVQACNSLLHGAIRPGASAQDREDSLAKAEAVYQVTLRLMTRLCDSLRSLARSADAMDPVLQDHLAEERAKWNANLHVCEDLRESLHLDIARIRHVRVQDRNRHWASTQVRSLVQGAMGMPPVGGA